MDEVVDGGDQRKVVFVAELDGLKVSVLVAVMLKLVAKLRLDVSL